MSNTITCPECQTTIEVTEVMSAQLAMSIRSELEADLAERTRKLSADRTELVALQKQFDLQKSQLDEQVTVAIAKEREQILANARAEAQQAAAVEIQDRDEQLNEVKANLLAAQQQELQLRKQARQLEERARQLELENARRMEEERQKFRAELESEFADRIQKLDTDRNQLASLQRELDSRLSDLDEQVKTRVDKEREQIVAKAQAEAQQAAAVEIQDRDEQLTAAKVQLKAFETQELELRRKTRELEECAEQQELEVTRKMDEERQKIREAASKQAHEQNELKIAERDQKIEAMGRQLHEMQRRLDQGSQQTQGEVQEIALEQLLATEFPNDVIDPVAKGTPGADLLQHVFDANGRECGVILWESKRTKRWNDQWIGRAIEDQQQAKASCACIVTAAMPTECDHFGEFNGVWVASWPCVRSVAMALRSVVLEAAQARRATDGQHGKMELVYNYLAGPEFRNRVRGLVEPYMEMQADLEAERRAYNKHWNKRQKQLSRALTSTTGMYGDLQGIIGSGLGEIEGMDMLSLETIDAPEGITFDPE